MKLSSKMLCAVVIQAVGTLLAMISVGTPSWIVELTNSTDIKVGVWRACIDMTCVSVYDDHKSIVEALGSWLYAVQVGVTGGFVFYLVATVMTLILYICNPCQGQYRKLLFVAAINFVGVVMLGYGTFLYAYEAYRKLFTSHSHLHYGLAFYIASAGVSLGLASSIMYYLEYRDQSRLRGQYTRIN